AGRERADGDVEDFRGRGMGQALVVAQEQDETLVGREHVYGVPEELAVFEVVRELIWGVCHGEGLRGKRGQPRPTAGLAQVQGAVDEDAVDPGLHGTG